MKDIITSVIVMALSAFAYFNAETFSLIKRGTWNLAKNPAVYPRMIATVMFVLGAILLISTIMKGKVKGLQIDKGIFGNILKVVVLMFLYIIGVYILGFILATTLFMISVIMVFGGKIKTALIVSLPVTVGLYVIFQVLFSVPLPLGEIFSFWR